MKPLLRWLALSLCLCIGQIGFSAYAADPQGYRTLAEPQARAAVAKVEVIEFFSYTCPICFSYEPGLSSWVARSPERVVFKRVPIGLRASWVPAQKMYFALEVMGKADVMHKKVFNAIHVDKMSVASDEAIFTLIAALGLNRQQFTEAYNSTAVQTKLAQASQLQNAYGIDQVPLVSVDGRYLTSPAVAEELLGPDKSLSELQLASFKILDKLVSEARP